MALNQAQVNKLYNEMLGRNATFGDASDYDADYWVGKTAEQVKSGISGSSEFLNRKALVDAAGAGGISEADLDKSVLAGGWKTEHHSDFANSGQDLFDFNRDNNWKSGITSTGGNWATEQNAINQVLGATAANNYSTVGGTDGGGGVIDGSTLPVDTDTGTGSNYLTSNDLTSWWEGLDKPWLNQTDTNTSGGMDDFMKFIMFMSMMRPQGGGFGGGQYGYGGINPGGVQSAYNPMDNFQGMMDSFKSLNTSLLN
tara:strand:+ start:422 stop:1186 length:765 start_codon:yes stop_codon:yes gene_type:complete